MNRAMRRADRAQNRRALSRMRPQDPAPPAFRDWIAAQLANPPDERLCPFFQAAWDEMEAADWRMGPVLAGED
jgi:hypothetical protein